MATWGLGEGKIANKSCQEDNKRRGKGGEKKKGRAFGPRTCDRKCVDITILEILPKVESPWHPMAQHTLHDHWMLGLRNL